MFIFLQAAAALLFNQMLSYGAGVEVQPEEMLMAALSEFTDLTQVTKSMFLGHTFVNIL